MVEKQSRDRLEAMKELWPEGCGPEELGERPLLILLHGYGSHEGDLASLSHYLPEELNLVALRAPITIGPQSYTWYPFDTPGNPDPNLATEPVQQILTWLNEKILPQQTGPIAVLGFSMGAAIAIQLMRTAPEQFQAALNLSGFSINGALEGDNHLKELKPPLFWGRDPHDPVIGMEAVARTEILLPQIFTLTKKEYHGIGHSVSREELEDINTFLTTHLLS